MSTILDKILASKRAEIARARAAVPEPVLERRAAAATPVRDFRTALDRPGTVQVLAEVKKASPSAGVLRADFDPVAIARTYERHGAAAISVLTDEPFFQGHLSYLSAIRAAVSLPARMPSCSLPNAWRATNCRTCCRRPTTLACTLWWSCTRRKICRAFSRAERR
jgi:hypothetical protein